MATRWLAALAACTVVAFVALPAGAAIDENYWAGTWESHHKGTHLMMLYLKQSRGSDDVYGTYRHPHDKNGDKGYVQATAEGDFGKTLVGTYRSTKGGGGGRFTLHLGDDLNTFQGRFWPCKRFCSGIRWTGNQPGFG